MKRLGSAGRDERKPKIAVAAAATVPANGKIYAQVTLTKHVLGFSDSNRIAIAFQFAFMFSNYYVMSSG